MKKRWKIWFIILSVLLIFSGWMYYLLFGSPIVTWNDNRLEDAVRNLSAETITLEDLVPFEWDIVYTFAPYTSREDIADAIGFDSPEIKETVSEFMTQLLFVKDNKIVSSICKYPDNAGFYIDLREARRGKLTDGGYAYAKYGDNILFAVEQTEHYKYLNVAERGTNELFTCDNIYLEGMMFVLKFEPYDN